MSNTLIALCKFKIEQSVDGEMRQATYRIFTTSWENTRMLWFMRSDEFPWEENDKGVLPVAKMTRKLGESKLWMNLNVTYVAD